MSRLIRVLKNIKKRSGTHRQAYYVKKAAPGDRYAQRMTPDISVGSDIQSNDSQDGDLSQAQDDIDTGQMYDHLPRMVVDPLVMPWVLSSELSPDDAKDPVSNELRRRFDPKNKHNRIKDPINMNVPLYSISPGEDMLWSGTDQELLNRLRTGIVTSVRVAETPSNSIMAKIEAIDGVVERAYIRFEELIEPQVYEMFGDMYDIRRDRGDLCRRSAAAYELAKASGFDDIIPPTVFRYDEHDGLEPIMSMTVIDNLSARLGCSAVELKRKLGHSAAVELWTDDTHPLVLDPWFIGLVSDDDGSGLNAFFDTCPWRPFLLRAAAFDFLAGTGSRTLAEVVCCGAERHPLHLVRNDLIFPDPVAMGVAYLSYGQGAEYTSGCPENQYAPIMWNELSTLVALRGFDDEEHLFDEIGYVCARRLQGDSVVNLIRSLTDHGISSVAIAGMLARAAFLRYGARIVMRNPLIIAQYYASLVSGSSAQFTPGFDIDIFAMEDSIDKAISKATMTSFSITVAMTGEGND